MKSSFIGCLLLAFTQILFAQTTSSSEYMNSPQANEVKLLKTANYEQAVPEYRVNYEADTPLFSRKKDNSTIYLHAGTPVHLRTIELIEFDELMVGQALKFMVAKDVVVNGAILIRSNVVATGIVTAKKAATVSTPASIIVEATGVNAVDGQTISLTSQGQRFLGAYPGQSFRIPVNRAVIAYITNNQMIAVTEE